MQAIIMAGGKGTRLGPYTAIFPKPLMPVGEMPILEILLKQLKKAGVTDVILAVNHLSHLIRAFFGSGETLGINLRYHMEERPLGTAGALGQIRDQLEDNFFVLNGDLLTNLSFSKVMDEHLQFCPAATVAVYSRTIKSEFGVLNVSDDNQIIDYKEKPSVDHIVSMGFYAFNREAISFVGEAGYLDMPQLILRLIAAKKVVKAYKEDCFWLDIGRPDDYAQAQQMMVSNSNLFIGY